MDLRKLALSNNLPYALSQRRKVVSGFSVGVAASLLVLSVFLFSYSVKQPFVKPILLQGHTRFGGRTSIVSWPFSFPRASSSSSLGVRDSAEKRLEKAHDLNKSALASDAGGLGLRVTSGEDGRNFSQEAKIAESAKNQTIFYSNKGEMLPRKTHLGNSSEGVKNWSFTGGRGRIFEKTGRGVNGGSVYPKINGSNSSMIKSAEGFSEDSSNGGTRVSESNNAGSLSYNGGHGMPPGEKEGALGNRKTGNFPEKSGRASSSKLTKLHRGLRGRCDIFDGRWVRDDLKPYYSAGSCPYIDRDFDCHLNGRPDDVYIHWRWQPNQCDIPSLNATDFLERLRGKKLVFVGDSLNRNMWESLVCILRQSIHNKKRVYEISGSTNFKKKGIYAFRFEDYNCTVDFVGAPFLVRESSYKAKSGSIETLRLDLMDRSTSMYHDADVVIFNTGHWWTHEKTSRGEDYYQEGNHVHPRLKVLEAYKRALTTWATWVDKNINVNTTQVFFRGYSVTHFRGGQWNSGGQCHKEIEPISNETYLAKYPSKMRALEHVLQNMKTPVTYLNISRLTDYRKDAHPSIYRKKYESAEDKIAAEQSQDCSHWCLPGVPDTWNELLYASLLNLGKGSWRN